VSAGPSTLLGAAPSQVEGRPVAARELIRAARISEPHRELHFSPVGGPPRDVFDALITY